jgi:hypothetical protein
MDELARLNMALKATFLKIGIYKKADMAEYLGYKSPYFSGVINGKERLSDQFLKNISDKVGISKDYILKGEGDMTVNEQVSENNTGVGIIGNNVNGGGISNNNDSVMLRMLDLLHKKEEALERRDAEIQRLLDIIERGQGR